MGKTIDNLILGLVVVAGLTATADAAWPRQYDMSKVKRAVRGAEVVRLAEDIKLDETKLTPQEQAFLSEMREDRNAMYPNIAAYFLVILGAGYLSVKQDLARLREKKSL